MISLFPSMTREILSHFLKKSLVVLGIATHDKKLFLNWTKILKRTKNLSMFEHKLNNCQTR